jgi:hypothetical protein
MVRKKNFLVSDMQFTEPERYKFIQHYDLHGIMKFQVRYNNKKNLIYNYNFPYSYFKVDHVDNPSIILNIAPFKPNNEECDVVFHKYYIKKNYLYFKEQHGFFSWHVEFQGIGKEKTIINFYWNRLPPKALFSPYYFPQIAYMEPLMDLKLAERGYCLLHSAAVSHEKKAILFAGRSGASKRTIAAYYLNKMNYSFIGDDKVIIKDGKVFSYPMNIAVCNYSFKRDYTKKLSSLLEKVKTVHYLYKMKDKLIFEFGLEDKASIHSINILSKFQEIEEPLICPKKREEVISSLINNNLAEFTPDFYNSLVAYSYIFPESLNSSYSKLLKKNLDISLDNDIRMNEIILGTDYTKRQFDTNVGEFFKSEMIV